MSENLSFHGRHDADTVGRMVLRTRGGDGRLEPRPIVVGPITGRDRTLFEALPQPLWIHDVETLAFLDVNAAALRRYGYTRDEFLALTLYDIVHQGAVGPAWEDAAFHERSRDANPVRGRHRLKDGSLIDVEITAIAVECDDFGARLVLVSDITQRKRDEEEIRSLNSELERRLQRVAALRRIDLGIIGGGELTATLGLCLDGVLGQLQPDAALILLCDPDGGTLHHAVSRGLRTDALRQTRLFPALGLGGRAIAARRRVIVTDLARAGDDCGWLARVQEEGLAGGSGCAVPLVAKGEVKGVLEVYHRTSAEPSPEWLEYLETLAGQAAIAIDNTWLLVDQSRSHAELADAYDATIEGWSRALDLRDQETEGHSRRVTEMTLELARAMGVRDAELVHIRRGALLHDIGKMGVPDRVLNKPGPLNEEEWCQMRRHPQYALDMLEPIPFLRPALEIPYCHHERWDGQGYPAGLHGVEIPLAARIFAAVDVWDALRSDRPYRPAWTEPRVREHLRSLAGNHLDPAVVEVFLRTLARIRPIAEEALSDAAADGASGGAASGSIGPALTPSGRHDDELLGGRGRAGMTILVAEDLSPAAQELTRILESLGHAVRFASSEDQAWPIIEEGQARLLLTDWTTTGIDGPRLCRRIRRQTGQAYTYIIVMTDRGDSAARLECLRAGADDFLSRPIDARELAAPLEIARRILAMQEELEQKNARLAELVTIDPLTGLKNRRHFDEVLEAAFSHAARHGQPLSVVMLDVDDFKRYNDAYGHPAGDEILCVVAQILQQAGREHDVAARYGGEEFAILLPGTDSAGSRVFAERLRHAIAAHPWPRVPVTASLGIATALPETADAAALVDRADRALYQSKRLGRDRVTHHEDLTRNPAAVPLVLEYAAYPFQD